MLGGCSRLFKPFSCQTAHNCTEPRLSRAAFLRSGRETVLGPSIHLSRKYSVGDQPRQHGQKDRTKSRGIAEWANGGVERSQGYKPRREKLSAGDSNASGCFQVLLGPAAKGAYSCNRVGKIPSNRCWWCGRGEKNSAPLGTYVGGWRYQRRQKVS